jgi:hypothetical protein
LDKELASRAARDAAEQEIEATIQALDATAAAIAAAPLHPADDPDHLRRIREDVYGSPAEVRKYWDQYKIYDQYMTVD